jgi:hypothetical protein
MGAIERRALARCVLLAVAMVEDDLRRALDEQDLAALGGAIQRRHEPMFRFERDDVEAGIGGLLRRPVDPELGGERIERALGRIALDLPDAVLAAQLRVVAERRDAPQELENGVLANRSAVARDLALAGVPLASDLERSVRGHGRGNHHFHQRQRSGLVGADARDRAQGFDRRQAAHDRVAACHPLHPDGERDRNQSWQAFGDHRHRDPGDRLEHLDERNIADEMAVGKGDRADDENDYGDRVAELLDLHEQRRLERADAGEHLVDAPELGVASRADDDAGRPAGHD